MTQASSRKHAGAIFILIPILINIPYGILVATFHYPEILRHPAGEILLRFHDAGPALVLTWWAFGMIGLPLIYSLIVLHVVLNREGTSYLMAGTVFGILGIVTQLVGLLRWTFVVPGLAEIYANPQASATAKESVVVIFQVVHQYGGVVLGEHLGQLSTILWMITAGTAMLRSPHFPTWLGWIGIIAALVYLSAQLELFGTVLPGIPEVPMAGMVGSVLWLLWLILIGMQLVRLSASPLQR